VDPEKTTDLSQVTKDTTIMVVIKVDTAVDTRVVVAVEKRVVITVVLIMVTDVIAEDTCLKDIIRKTYFSNGK
jgi:hypothetical protein